MVRRDVHKNLIIPTRKAPRSSTQKSAGRNYAANFRENLFQLDFSHLRARGIEIRSSEPNRPEAMIETPTPTDHGDAAFGHLGAPFSECLCQHPCARGFSLYRVIGRSFLRVVGANRHEENLWAYVEGLIEAVCYAA